MNDLDAETNQTLEVGLKDYIFGSVIQLNAFVGRTKEKFIIMKFLMEMNGHMTILTKHRERVLSLI